MFNAIIINQNDQPIYRGSLEPTASPALYFAGCVALLVDFLNGAIQLNQQISNTNTKGIKPISTTLASQSAIAMFINTLHKHSAFAPEKVFDKNSENLTIFQQIASILHIPIDDTSTHIYFLDLVSQIKVEGIKSIKFEDKFTQAQRNLYICNFPDKWVPENYFCSLSSQVMDEPCFDMREPKAQTFFDRNKIQIQIDENGKNPYTNFPLTRHELSVNQDLQTKINNFIRKVILIPKNFPETYNQEYLKYKEDIQNESMTFQDLEEKIKKDIGEKQGSLNGNDNLSVKALIDKKTKINPYQLYRNALDDYKNKRFDQALFLLQEALKLFEEKTGKADSEECLKCFSTIISCYREQKNYDQAISYAEQAIILFAGKIDITALIKKHKECLSLRGNNAADLYEEAVRDYKDKNYFLTINKSLLALEFFELHNEKAKQAYCHSLLASCYREQKNYEEALEHCEKTLELRKQCLHPKDPLIQDTEKKYNEIKQLLMNSKLELK